MALPVHNTTTSSSNSFASSLSFSHTTAGADKILVVGIHVRSATVTINAVTHNGNALALVPGSNVVANSQTLALYYMVAPDASGNVVVTLSGGTNVIAIANSYTGVDQSTPLGTAQTANQLSGTTISITLSSASDEMGIDIFGNRNGDTPVITGGQTLRGTVDSGSQINAAASEEVGAASTVMSWSIPTSGIGRLQSGVPLKGAGGGGGSTLVADSGSYTYTGTNAELIRAKILNADSGNYNYTGSLVNLLKGFILNANAGSYSYLGQNATLTFTPAGAFVLTADSGNYTYTGTDINFNRDRVIIMSSGTYNYNGTDIQIILPGQIWTDKPSVSTNWNDQTNVTTIWTDK